jgi:glycosyltransferase involved in cell wall biosynthesis
MVPKEYDNYLFIKRGISTARHHLKKYIENISKINPDILIINNAPFVMASLPYIPWHIFRFPVIHSISEFEVKPFLALHFWWDSALSVSPIINRVAKGLPGSDRLNVCPLGIKVNKLTSRNYNGGTDKNILQLVWVGRVDIDQKRADLIPQIACELESKHIKYHWNVLGKGADLKTVENTLHKNGILHKFTFFGGVPRQKVFEILGMSDVLILPSDCEGLSQALLEAMSLGVVPVTSYIPDSTNYVIQHGKEGFLCERGNAKSFSKQIEILYKNRGLLIKMGHASMEKVKTEFNHHRFAQNVMSNIENTMKSGIARSTPLPIKSIYTRDEEMKGRTCSGLLWSIGIFLKYGILKKKFLRRRA